MSTDRLRVSGITMFLGLAVPRPKAMLRKDLIKKSEHGKSEGARAPYAYVFFIYLFKILPLILPWPSPFDFLFYSVTSILLGLQELLHLCTLETEYHVAYVLPGMQNSRVRMVINYIRSFDQLHQPNSVL